MKKIFAALALISVPSLVFAQNTQYISNIFDNVKYFLGLLIPLLTGLATIYFIWTVIEFVRAKDETKRKEFRAKMIAGIIGLFVIVSVWGIIRLLGFTFGITQGGNSVPPCPPGLVWSSTLRRCQ